MATRGGRLAGAAALVALAVACTVAAAPATEVANKQQLVQELQRGGLVLAIRHTATDFSKPDAERVVLRDCTTQRNLSAKGRAEARGIGRHARRLRLRIGSVLSSAYCRTLETARLAFGRATISPALLNTIVAPHDARWRAQIRAFRRLLGTRPPAGTLTVLVTHAVVVSDATGLTLEEGETLVFRPLDSSRFRLVGRILALEWADLHRVR